MTTRHSGRRRVGRGGAHVFPGDAFSLILLLLLFQHQLDEELLQLFVAVVDAELFEATAQQQQQVRVRVNYVAGNKL